LIQRFSVEETAAHFGFDKDKVETMLDEARKKLFDVRNERPRPHLDDKIITAWNSLMISGFAKAGAAFGSPKYIGIAKKAVQFILSNLYDRDTRTLLRIYRQGPGVIKGFADDYAGLACALIDLYEATLEIEWLQQAVEIQQQHDLLFTDSTNGGFFRDTGSDPSVLIRMKDDSDGAEPSHQSVAAQNLLRLRNYGLDGDNKMTHNAEAAFVSSYTPLLKSPLAIPLMTCAVDTYFSPVQQIIIIGQVNANDTNELLSAVHKVYHPNRVLMLADQGAGHALLSKSFSFIENAEKIDGKATAFLCENQTCQLPTNNPLILENLLRKSIPAASV